MAADAGEALDIQDRQLTRRMDSGAQDMWKLCMTELQIEGSLALAKKR